MQDHITFAGMLPCPLSQRERELGALPPDDRRGSVSMHEGQIIPSSGAAERHASGAAGSGSKARAEAIDSRLNAAFGLVPAPVGRGNGSDTFASHVTFWATWRT